MSANLTINLNTEDLWKEAAKISNDLGLAISIASNPDWDIETRTRAAVKILYTFNKIGKMFDLESIESVNYDDFLGSIKVAMEETLDI